MGHHAFYEQIVHLPGWTLELQKVHVLVRLHNGNLADNKSMILRIKETGNREIIESYITIIQANTIQLS